MGAVKSPIPLIVGSSQGLDARAKLQKEASNELVFAIVGGAGSGTGLVARQLEILLKEHRLSSGGFSVFVLKASKVIRDWAEVRGKSVPPELPKTIQTAELLQNLGDEMRAGAMAGIPDYSAVALALIAEIQRTRASQTGQAYTLGEEVRPDGSPRAYILDSLRHPAEVHLLREVYGDAFILVGVVCEQSKREQRMTRKYKDCGVDAAHRFMARDTADSERKHGQQVADAFHLADFFVDNSIDRLTEAGDSSRDWKVSEDLSRLVKIVTGTAIERPKQAETAMYHAYSSQMQSACLSRQVGAALVDRSGNIVATGANEVPKAGGGVYGESTEGDAADGRCAFWGSDEKFCRNTREQNAIIDELLTFLEQQGVNVQNAPTLKTELRKTRIGGLLEFSRAVHAEMDAILSAARKGVSVQGTRLFVTTFPCHYCARHLVSAGVEEVQFIEPYPKSQALILHKDSITSDPRGWKVPPHPSAKVLFRPFTGVSPRLYRRAFLKTGELKDKASGTMRLHDPYWTSPWYLPKIGYVTVEARLVSESKGDA